MHRHARIAASSTLTSKGQTTVPKEIREVLGLSDGTLIDWIVSDGALTVRPRTLRAVDLAGVMGKPPNGRHLTIEEMDEVVGKAAVKRLVRSKE
jgi:antitoxin PrlF